MKQLITLLIFIFHTATAFSQLPILFNEDFDDSSNSWYLGDYSGYNAKIENGKFNLRNKTELGRYFFQPAILNPKEDFTFGLRLKITKSKKNYGNGLVWGYQDGSGNLFTITRNGYFRIYYLRNNETILVKDFTKSDKINTGAEYNMLAISKVGMKIKYFINGSIVHEDYFAGMKGTFHGFMLASDVVEVDKFIIKHPKPKINLVDNPINGYEKKNLGANVNSYAGEISPKVSSDGNLLFVCRGGHRSNLGASLDYDQDAWFAEKVGEEDWGKLKNMGKPINDEKQNAIASISADNNTVLINYDGRSNPGLMISHRTASGWSSPTRVDVADFYNMNKDTEWSLGPNGKVLIFSAERKDSHGEKDLYVSFRNSDASWTKPKNLGKTVNTFTTDFGPYLAADNRTLYFGSQGHPGYGSSDIFVTKRLDDSWTNWSVPKNLGPEINTPNWDAYYTITASGEDAYMSTVGSFGSTDIFRIKLKEDEEDDGDEDSRPDPVVLIKGKVFDQKNNKPMTATITYSDIKTGKEAGIARSDPRTGRYQISLPYGTHYAFIAEATGYVSISENINLIKKGRYNERTKNLYLAKIEVGETVNMKNVFFKVATAKILPDSYQELDRVVKLMKENPTMEIKIKGHTDNLGPVKRLKEVSEMRAKAIRDYLFEHGITENRLQWEGYGGTDPIADNSDPVERVKNRRVEFEILKN